MRVLDASVVIKWFKPDEISEAANTLLEAHLTTTDIVFAPTLLLYEFSNVFVNSRTMTAEELVVTIDKLFTTQINFIVPDASLTKQAIEIADTEKVTVYDASYVALAQHLQCPFVTADKKLFTKVRHLGAIELL
jgi:predicted nucleic acid-binding protein